MWMLPFALRLAACDAPSAPARPSGIAPPVLPRVAFSAPKGPFREGTTLNLRGPGDTVFFRDGTACWTASPGFSRADGSRAVAECPGPLVADEAWNACPAGLIQVAKIGPPTSCVCLSPSETTTAEVTCPFASVPALGEIRPGMAPTVPTRGQH